MIRNASRAVLIAALCLGAHSTRAEDNNAAGKGSLPDVLIQAEQNKPVTREKPPLQFGVKEDMPLESVIKTEEDIRLRLPSEVAKSTPFAAGLSNSSYVAAPSSNRIILLWKGEPVRVFAPVKELAKVYQEADAKTASAKVQWELVVANAAGAVFRKFSGVGSPPDHLDFDGKSDDGKWLNVGQVYTNVLIYRDASGRAHTAMGRPFSLQGLAIQRNDGFVISLDPQALFEKGGSGYRLSESGQQLLREATRIIQRYYPGLGLSVAAHVSWLDATAAQQAAASCAKEAARLLMMPAATVAAQGYAGTPDLERRVDIQVLNR